MLDGLRDRLLLTDGARQAGAPDSTRRRAHVSVECHNRFGWVHVDRDLAVEQQVADLDLLIGHPQRNNETDELDDDEGCDRVVHDDETKRERLERELLWLP